MSLDFTKLPGVDHNYRDVRGHILLLPSGIVAMPFRYDKDGWWTCILVGGDDARYPVGGHDIAVPPTEIDAARRVLISSEGSAALTGVNE